MIWWKSYLTLSIIKIKKYKVTTWKYLGNQIQHGVMVPICWDVLKDTYFESLSYLFRLSSSHATQSLDAFLHLGFPL